MDRQGRLAETAGAGHHGDADRARVTARPRSRQQVAQAFHLFIPAGEIGDIGGQLRRDLRAGPCSPAGPRPGRGRALRAVGGLGGLGGLGGGGSGGCFGCWFLGRHRHQAGRDDTRYPGAVFGQQIGVQLAQLGAGIDAELVGDGVPRPPVGLERLGVTAGAVQRPHQQQPQAFPQRMVGQQPAGFGDGLGVPAAGELRRDPEFGGFEAELVEPFGLRLDERGVRDVSQRLAVPQRECLGELPGRALRVTVGEGLPAVAHHGLEHQRVRVRGGHPKLVAGSAGDQQRAVRVVHEPAQPQHVDADEVGRLGRRFVPPHLADQHVGGDNLPRADQQGGQDGTPLRGPDPPPVFSGPDLKRPEQPEPHHYPGITRLRLPGHLLRQGTHLITTQLRRKPRTPLCAYAATQPSEQVAPDGKGGRRPAGALNARSPSGVGAAGSGPGHRHWDGGGPALWPGPPGTASLAVVPAPTAGVGTTVTAALPRCGPGIPLLAPA